MKTTSLIIPFFAENYTHHKQAIMAHICDKCAQESHISITSSDSEENYSPITPKQKPECYHHCSRTPGHTPSSKRVKKALFCSPRTKAQIDEIHHYQKHQIDLQRQLHYGQNQLYHEQQRTSARLSVLERMASFFCGSNKHDVHEPMPCRPSTSTTPNSWDRNYNENEGARNKWSPWAKRIENDKNSNNNSPSH
jgi:hypothetical protein